METEAPLEAVEESVDQAEAAIDAGEPEAAKKELADIRAALAQLQGDVEGVRGTVTEHTASVHQSFEPDDHSTLSSLAKDLRSQEMAEHGPERTHRRYKRLFGGG